jgi:hypothetical protein
MYVERGSATVIGFVDHVSQQLQCIGEAGGEGVLEREWRRLPLSGLGKIGGEEAVDDDRGNFSLIGVRQTMTAFDLAEESRCDQHALLFKDG